MRRLRAWLVILGVLLLAGLTLGGTVVYYTVQREPLPWASSCTARVGADSVRLEPAQFRNAAIIAGVAARRGLPPQAVTIGLATALQESGLRNLDYGDRDSLGLFQQRPSQGWGTEAQIMDPHYAANAFFAAMVKEVENWQTMHVGDVAQAVQRSGFPDAYDKHIPAAETLAGALTGTAPAALTCAIADLRAGDAAGLASALGKTLPTTSAVKRTGATVTVAAPNPVAAWSAAAIAVAHAQAYGVRAVSVDGRTWRNAWPLPGGWDAGGAAGTTVTISLG
nr:hypothetical protein [Propionibacterium sp.]